MSSGAKLLIGLAAAVLTVWVHHGPLGNGARLIESLQTRAEAVVAQSGIAGIEVSLARDPMRRVATLAGPADEFQRYGMGGQPGLTQMVAEVEGIAAVRWADGPGGRFVLPLIAELLIAAFGAYCVGLALGWLVWGRPPRQGFA